MANPKIDYFFYLQIQESYQNLNNRFFGVDVGSGGGVAGVESTTLTPVSSSDMLNLTISSNQHSNQQASHSSHPHSQLHSHSNNQHQMINLQQYNHHHHLNKEATLVSETNLNNKNMDGIKNETFEYYPNPSSMGKLGYYYQQNDSC